MGTLFGIFGAIFGFLFWTAVIIYLVVNIRRSRPSRDMRELMYPKKPKKKFDILPMLLVLAILGFIRWLFR